MRTGLKILTRSLINKFITNGVSRTYFPNTPVPRIQLRAFLERLDRQLNRTDTDSNLGALFTPPDPFVAQTYGAMLRHNPNHLGTWTGQTWESDTTKMEHDVIEKMVDLYGAKGKRITGYVTSGATEGNLFSVWAGKTYLARNRNKGSVALLSTSLTHYSIRKAASICGIPLYAVPLDRDTWGMHPMGLSETVDRLSRNGVRGFLVPLTLGYTSTGTLDDVQAITRQIRTIMSRRSGLQFFVWIDAALNGLIEPFLEPAFTPFSAPLIQTVVTDFHKFGKVPYPAGLILYRKHLRPLIEKPIEYLQVTDTTVSGSRPGASAVAIWAAIHHFGRDGYRRMVKEQMKNKQLFIDGIRSRYPEAILINNERSLSCGVIFPSRRGNTIPDAVAETYWLNPAKTDILFYPHTRQIHDIYKFFFLPHVKKQTVLNFFRDIEKTGNEVS